MKDYRKIIADDILWRKLEGKGAVLMRERNVAPDQAIDYYDAVVHSDNNRADGSRRLCIPPWRRRVCGTCWVPEKLNALKSVAIYACKNPEAILQQRVRKIAPGFLFCEKGEKKRRTG